MKDTIKVKKVNKKGINVMYPELTSKIVISYANDVTSGKGVPYIAVGHVVNGFTHNLWFPVEYADFAKSHVGKEVTATFRFFSSRNRTYLTGLSLSE